MPAISATARCAAFGGVGCVRKGLETGLATFGSTDSASNETKWLYHFFSTIKHP